MVLNIENIKNIISEIPFVKQINFIEQREFCIFGGVEINFEGLDNSINFDFIIAPQYPLKTHDSESIIFINKELVTLNHVMSEGNICIHTSHNTNLKEKLLIDFNSLKNWIIKYYINKDSDNNYEHIIVKESAIDDKYYSYIFTECDNHFLKGEYGDVHITSLNNGVYKDKVMLNFLIQGFTSIHEKSKNCQWSNYYKNRIKTVNGFYYFIQDAPATLGKFGFSSYQELSTLLSTDFLNQLHEYEERNLKKNKDAVIPLFLGYKINATEIHWQVILIKVGDFPLKGVSQKVDGVKTGKWNSELIDKKITWGLTRNASYKYFFGRGVFSDELINNKILIIGIGAIGSMIAQTLTRCGCKYIDFIDYDIKEPENICRSEYTIINGITEKTQELNRIVCEISPFVNSKPLNNDYFELLVKSFFTDKKYRKKIEQDLNNYDLIIDCSTDNDLMYVLDSLTLNANMINISITNHAKEMICAFYPNIYKFVNNQFSNVLKNDTYDLYEPTGCWSPTFKASYNDIDVLVQLALKHINELILNKKQKNNFVIKYIDNNFKIIEF